MSSFEKFNLENQENEEKLTNSTESNSDDNTTFEKIKKQAKKILKIGALSALTMTGPAVKSNAGGFDDVKNRANQSFSELQERKSGVKDYHQRLEEKLSKRDLLASAKRYNDNGDHKKLEKTAGVVEEKTVVLNNESKMVFQFNKDKQVIGVKLNFHSDYENYKESMDLLKDNWPEILMKSGTTQDKSLARDVIEMKAKELLFGKKILNKLIKLKKENSPEYKFLKDYISKIIRDTEKEYGDVFK